MNILCPKCGKEFADTELKCPFCGETINKESDDVLVVPSIEEISPQVEEITPVVEAQPQVEETIPVVEVQSQVEEATPVVETEAPKLANVVTASLDENGEAVLETESIVENISLETVSVMATDEVLTEKEEVIEIPEMPEPTIGEINPDLLGNKYDEEERINNEKLEIRKKQAEEEMEKKRLEAEAKSQVPMEKPDLLARIPESDESGIEIKPAKKKEKKMRKLMNILIIILGLAVVAVVIWYLLFQNKDNKENNNYMSPINTYFTGYKEGDSTKMLSSFVPCVAESEEITSLITTTVQTRNQYGEISLEYKEKNTEVVNSSDQGTLDEYLTTTCGTNIPKITEYKHVFIEQKIKTQEEKEYTQNNPEFWNVKIEDKWYILLIN